MEAEEGLEKIQVALKICDLYISSYFNHKDKMIDYFKEKPVMDWNFESAMIFCNLNKFINQLKVIQVRNKLYCVLLELYYNVMSLW